MSNKGLAAAAARFLEVGERHDAARGRRKKTSTRKPRRAKPVVDNLGVELVQPVVRDVEVPQPVVGVEEAAEQTEFAAQVEAVAPATEDFTAAESAAEAFGPVAEAEVAEVAEVFGPVAEAEAFERPAAYVDP